MSQRGNGASATITTTLIPSTQRYPDWHMRIHRITIGPNFKADSLISIEGGFAIAGTQRISPNLLDSKSKKSRTKPTHRAGQKAIPPTDPRTLSRVPLDWSSTSPVEGVHEDGTSALILSSAGASGIRSLDIPSTSTSSTDKFRGQIIRPDSNTNLIGQRTLIPTISSTLWSGGEREIITAVAVFAIAGRKSLSDKEVRRRWEVCPTLGGDEDIRALGL